MKAVQFSSVTGQANSIPQEILDGPSWMLDIYTRLPYFCSYDDVAAVTGMNRGSVANYHSEGRGPKGSLLVGKRRCFPRLEVIKWIMAMDEGKGA